MEISHRMPSTYTICYEAIQRTYRNSVVRVARERLPVAYPDDWREKLKKPYRKTWQQMMDNARERRTTGEISTAPVDDFDYLGVSDFFSLFEAFFDVLFTRATDATDRGRQQERQAVLGWAKEVRGLRDPMSHPSDEDLPYDDAFRMLDAAHRILLKLDPDAALKIAEAKKELLTPNGSAPNGQEARPPLEGYLPPPESIAVCFVGRAAQLGELRNWFGDKRRRRWALMGDGGKGKTAIAYEFACEVKDEAPSGFEFVIWMSAKRRRFVEGVVETIHQPDFYDLRSALSWLLLHYGDWDEKGLLAEQEARDLCLRLLDEFPALIIVDDVDSLEGEEESAIEFFSVDVPTTKSKVLHTSRRKLTGLGATTTVVEGFNDEDGGAFIKSRVQLYGLASSVFTPAICKQILHATDRSPLFIEELLRFCTLGVTVQEAIREWQKRGGDEARKYALRREFDMLSKAAKDTLFACCVADDAMSLADIQDVTGLSAEAAMSAIEELQRLFLVPKPEIIEQVPRFDLNVNTRFLVRVVAGDDDRFRRIQAAWRARSSDYLASPYRRRQISAYVTQAVGLARQGRQEDAEKTLKAGLQEYPDDPDLLGQLGWLYKIWRTGMRVADAREHFEHSKRQHCTNSQMYYHWAEMESREEEWTKAARVADAGLQAHPGNASLMYWAGYARSRLGQELMKQWQPKAEDELVEACKLLRGALLAPEQLAGYRDRQLQSRAFRALALALNSLLRFLADQSDHRTRRADLAREALAVLDRWVAEHPDDAYARSESARLAPTLRVIVEPNGAA